MSSAKPTQNDSSPLELEPIGSLDEVADDWERLALASGNLFATPSWIECWSRHTPDFPKHTVYQACRRPDGSLAAILPLVLIEGRHVRKLRLAGFGAGWGLGPICAPEDLDSAYGALGRALSVNDESWDAFFGDDLAATGRAEQIGARLLYELPSPLVRLECPSWEEFLNSRAKRLRHETKRLSRRAQERGLAFRLVEEEAELFAVLDVLFAQHLKRWGKHAAHWFAGRPQLHREFAREALSRGWLRLLVAEENEEIVGVSLGYRMGSSEWSYQASRKIATETSGLGLLVRAEKIKRALEDGVRYFWLGPGAQEEKLRFATDVAKLETVAIACTFRGRLALRRVRAPEEG